MNKIGIVVCNYNKAEYVVNCIESIFVSNVDNFDVYVVDNASTDDSVSILKKRFGDRIQLLVNEKNLGGSGGFNTGLREVLKKDYQYIMCVDNDILMDSNTIKVLYDFLEQNPDVGMVGSKICVMDEPDRIQTYGAVINFDTYDIKDLHRGCLDDENLPEVQYCDYVPACSLMARADAIRKVGIMPEDNFIYWDDMEWGYCFKLAGYQVAAIKASSVLHKGGKSVNPTTFQKYYMFRNRLNFFMKYVKEERIEHFVHTILSELYRSVCACYLKKEYNMIQGFMFAYDDALHGVRGIAGEGRILPRIAPDRFEEIIQADTKVAILFDGNYRGLTTLKGKLGSMIPLENIAIVTETDKISELQVQYCDCKIVDSKEEDSYDVLFQMCPHIFQVQDVEEGAVCVDQWLNLLITEEDYVYGKNFEANEAFFITCNEKVFVKKIEEANQKTG